MKKKGRKIRLACALIAHLAEDARTLPCPGGRRKFRELPPTTQVRRSSRPVSGQPRIDLT